MPEKHMITENGLMTRIVAETLTTNVTFYQCIESEEVWIPMGIMITSDGDWTIAYSDYPLEFLYDDRLTGRAGAHGQQRKEVFVETSFQVTDIIGGDYARSDYIVLDGDDEWCATKGWWE